jgi:putative acetyltransferase
VRIRPETATDLEAIRRVNLEAFAQHPISRQTEHLIVDALRAAGVLVLSLVAVVDDEVVGHIAFSPVPVGETASGWLLVGPVAVLPDHQGQGFGSALVSAGLAETRTAGALGCVLVGDPGFYGRFGFAACRSAVYEGVPGEFLLCLSFSGGEPTGAVTPHAAFSIEPGADGAPA